MLRGIYKGFKYITHIFVVKEEEIEIGMPTDVKHVAHIGIDGPSGSAPSWMNDFKAAPEFSSSLGSSPITESATRREHASSLPPQQASGGGLVEESERDVVASDIPKARKKHKRKKAKSASSPNTSASSSPSHPHVSRPSRPAKSKLKNNTHDHDRDRDHDHDDEEHHSLISSGE